MTRVGWMIVAGVMVGGLAVPVGAYDDKGNRDPLVALVTPEGALREPRGVEAGRPAVREDVVLEGIVYDPQGQSLAIIGGQLFRQGEVRQGVEVVTIEPSRVIVMKDGAQRELRAPTAPVSGDGAMALGPTAPSEETP